MTDAETEEDYISQRIAEIHSQYNQYGISGLSQAYEEFKKELAMAEAAAYKGEAGALVLQRIKDLENLFSTVTGNDVKELLMFMKDSEALRRTAEFASLNANHIKFGDLGHGLPIPTFIKAARQYMNPDLAYGADNVPQDPLGLFKTLDWSKLGHWFFAHTKAPIASHFLYGPLATQRRRVGTRTRHTDDTQNTNKTTAQSVAAEDLQDDPEQSTSHMVRLVYGVLTEQLGDEPLNLYKFFINPASFAQSVENLFYTSFLVRDGKISLTRGEDGVPYIDIPEDEPDETADSLIAHDIASFNMAAWQKLIKEHDIHSSCIPSRAIEDDDFDDGDIDAEPVASP